MLLLCLLGMEFKKKEVFFLIDAKNRKSLQNDSEPLNHAAFYLLLSLITCPSGQL